jgi:integrase/recombinase XerD
VNLRVNLTKRIKTADGLRYCPAVVSGNGRIKPDWVVVNGQEERHPEGAYYIDWTESGGKRQRKSVGTAATVAQNRKLRKEAELNAVANGVAVVPDESESTGRNLTTAIADFIEETRLTKKRKTLYAYTKAMEYFAESCRKRDLEDIERIDMLKFAAFLREEKELSPRTCRNVFGNVMTFLKAQGLTGVVKKGDWPRFVQEEPEIYEKDELKTLYSACDSTEKLWWDFFLMTGMREQEVMHTTWGDVNLTQGVVRVSWKAEYGWTPKAYKERTIPIPSKLQVELKEAKKKAKSDCPLLFPTAGCKPKLNFLDDLKAAAKRAKLNPDRFYLHKFRATFATWHLWEGVDLRTVQDWLGHSDMESTLRYLKPSRGQAVRDKVDATFA